MYTQRLKTQIYMTLEGFEPANPTTERPHTHPLDRTATGIGKPEFKGFKFNSKYLVR